MGKSRHGVTVIEATSAIITAAVLNADICMCGHKVGDHNSSEVCRYKVKSGGGCGCASVRVER